MTTENAIPLRRPDHLSRWRRSRRRASLRLGEDVWTIERLPSGGWSLTPDLGTETAEVMAAAHGWSMEDAIRYVEAFLTIDPWQRTREGAETVWIAGPWRIVSGSNGALVYRGETTATRQVFLNADQGRAWAESRFHRSDRSLFGREYRTPERSTVTFPLVRATESERQMMESVVRKYGVTYSEFVRLSIEFFANRADVLIRKEDNRAKFYIPIA